MFFKKKLIQKVRKILKRQRAKYIEKINFEQERFISILNHDIKTPILAQIQALEIVAKKDENEFLKEILNSNRFLLQVVLNSIFLQKYELEKPKLNFERVNIFTEMKNCLEEINLMADEKKQNIVLKAPENVELEADRVLVRKIISNILTSSIVFGYENSDIEVFVKESKNKISFCAKNKSIFMTKEKIKGLLDDKKRHYRDFNQLGMNLNLSIANKLIQAHKWKPIASSQKNSGSVFGFVVKK
jgi:signal transduction histidine kinase